MEIKYTLPQKDFLLFQFYFLRWWLCISIIIIITFCATVGVYHTCIAIKPICAYNTALSSYGNFIVMPVILNSPLRILLFMFFGAALATLISSPFKALRYYDEHREKYQNTLTVQITPEALISCTVNTESKFAWNAVRKMTKTSSFIMFSLSKVPPLILPIPTRFFEHPEQAELFYQTALKYWQDAKTKAASP